MGDSGKTQIYLKFVEESNHRYTYYHSMHIARLSILDFFHLVTERRQFAEGIVIELGYLLHTIVHAGVIIRRSFCKRNR